MGEGIDEERHSKEWATSWRLTKGVVDVELANIVYNALNLTPRNDRMLLRLFERLNTLWIESAKMVARY